MSFLGIGPGELVLILVIAVIFLGPDKIPEVARTIGKMTRELKQITEGFESELRRELDEAAKLKDEASKPASSSPAIPDAAAKAVSAPEEQPELFIPEEYRTAQTTVEHREDSPASLPVQMEAQQSGDDQTVSVSGDNGREASASELVAPQPEYAAKEE
jgi:Tat protein translocase TatB subunit